MATTAGAMRAGGAFVEIFARDGQFHQAMTKLQNRLKATGTALKSWGTNAAIGAGMVGLPMVGALRQFTAFDDAIRATAAVTGAFGEEGAAVFAKLSDAARGLSEATGYTATEVANLMTELGRAGFNPDQVIAMTGAVLDLARASGTDATLASGIMAATIHQFGLEATDAARVADVLTHAANATFNSVESLGEALKYAGPVAADLGMSLEETAAILGTLGNVGIQGSMAGTTLRRLSVISAAEAQKLQGIFGVSFVDAAGNLRPLVDVLGEVAAATNGLPNAQRVAIFAEAFGLLGITGASAIGGVAADTRELTAELENANGVARKTAEAMNAGIGGAMRKLMAAVGGVALAFGDALAPTIQWLAAGASRLAGALRDLVKNFPIIAQLAAGVTAGVFALGVAALVGGFALTTLSAGVGVLATVMTATLGTAIGATVTAIAAGVASILVLAYNLSPAFAAEADAIMAALGRLDFASVFEILKLNAAIGMMQAAQAVDAGIHTISNAFSAAGDFIGDKLTEGLDRFMGLFGADILTLQSGLEKLGLYWKAAMDWDFWAQGLDAALADVDQKIAEARERAPTADARAAGRTAERQQAADARQAATDAQQAAYDAVIETLRGDLAAARDRANGATEDATKAETAAATAKENGAKATEAAATAAAGTAAAGPNLAGATAGTFGDGRGLGAGPELRPMEQTAANTASLVGQTDELITATEQLATRFDRVGEYGPDAGFKGLERPAAAPTLTPPAPVAPPPAVLNQAAAAAVPAAGPAESLERANDAVVAALQSLGQINSKQLGELVKISTLLSAAAGPAFA
jgi:TP901 family phage tail tape measure protein